MRDEIHPHGAYVTLERDGNIAPWSITIGVGAMVHTVFRGDETSARATYDALKAELERIVRLPQGQMSREIENLTAKY